MKLHIKPLSVNECWQGKRFKTAKYREYERKLLLMLPTVKIPQVSSICITLGMSNSASDLDNPIKPILDILQKKYDFNDKDIFILKIEKKNVKKGREFIEIKF